LERVERDLGSQEGVVFVGSQHQKRVERVFIAELQKLVVAVQAM